MDINEDKELSLSSREVEMFTYPQKVKKKRLVEIVIAQVIFCAVLTLILLLLKFFVPAVFENIDKLVENYIL